MKLVVALGGNALMTPHKKVSYSHYLSAVKRTCRLLAPIAKGQQLLIVHGNGTQVGDMLLSQGSAHMPLPLDVLVAQTQGQIGYLIEQSMRNELERQKSGKGCVCLLTHVLVDRKDPAFRNPTKPVGPFFSRPHGKGFRKIHGKYRLVVPSPRPVDIIKKSLIKELLVDNVVIACGGGGIPTIKTSGGYSGVPAVIDKDYAAVLAAKAVGAKNLLILTDVPGVYESFTEKNQRLLSRLTLRQAAVLLKDGHFAEGSMKPKIETAIDFVKAGGSCTIAHLDDANLALEGRAGTRVVP